jgi:hypothetical protein
MAADREKNLVRTALKAAFQDVAQFLIDQGVTAREFDAILAEAFVQAAQSRARLKNGKINQSRVAIITGYTRTEIRKILTKQRSAALVDQSFGAGKLLDGWSRDPEFSTRTGDRKPLPMTGNYGSFTRLVKKYSGDIPAKATLDEMKRIGAVKVVDQIVSVSKARGPSSKQRAANLDRASAQLSLLFQSLSPSHERSYEIAAVDSVTFDLADDAALRIAEDRAKQSSRAFMNGLESALRTLVLGTKAHKKGSQRSHLTLSLTISKSKSK